MLLKSSADPKAVADDGTTALHLASQCGRRAIVLALVRVPAPAHIRQSRHMQDSQGTYKTVKAHIRQSRPDAASRRTSASSR